MLFPRVCTKLSMLSRNFWDSPRKTTIVCKRIRLMKGGGGNIPEKKLFLFPICYIAEIVFLTHNYQSVLAKCEKHFRG